MSVLVVQMGHSGRTSGATGAPGEMAFTEAVGEACRRLLNRGAWVVRTIAADPAASAYRGDAFFAVHADGSTNPNVRGASVGYQTAEGAGLAHAWRATYVALGFTGPWNGDNYTVNLAQYYGVRTAVQEGNRRACIIECGTITNAADRALMLPDRVALAIGRAVGIEGLGGVDVATLDDTMQSYVDLVWRVKDLHDLITDTRVAHGRIEALLLDRDVVNPPGRTEVNVLAAKIDALTAKVDSLIKP